MRMLLFLGRFLLLRLREQTLPRAEKKARLSDSSMPVGNVIPQRPAVLQSWLWGSFC